MQKVSVSEVLIRRPNDLPLRKRRKKWGAEDVICSFYPLVQGRYSIMVEFSGFFFSFSIFIIVLGMLGRSPGRFEQLKFVSVRTQEHLRAGGATQRHLA